MPYISSENKEAIRVQLNSIEERLDQLDDQNFAGHINYMNYVLIRRRIEKQGKKYWKFALFVGTLVCCVIEVYRRLVASYEDECILKNGDAE